MCLNSLNHGREAETLIQIMSRRSIHALSMKAFPVFNRPIIGEAANPFGVLSPHKSILQTVPSQVQTV